MHFNVNLHHSWTFHFFFLTKPTSPPLSSTYKQPSSSPLPLSFFLSFFLFFSLFSLSFFFLICSRISACHCACASASFVHVSGRLPATNQSTRWSEVTVRPSSPFLVTGLAQISPENSTEADLELSSSHRFPVKLRRQARYRIEDLHLYFNILIQFYLITWFRLSIW